jgi:hypothetical protein
MANDIEITIDGCNPLRFIASSRTRETKHLVDLGGWSGNGSCSCEHFEFRLLPKLRERRLLKGSAGVRTAENSTRCSHILAARRSFTDSMIARISQSIPQAGETNHDEE